MAIIPLYVLGPNPPIEPYVAYDLTVDYPTIDIEPLPGIPKVGGVIRSYEYALYYHTITNDVDKEKARRPINIKKKSEFIEKIKRGNPISTNDHLSVKNSFYLAGNVDLWLAPDVGEAATVSGGWAIKGTSDVYLVYGDTNIIFWENNNTNNNLNIYAKMLSVYKSNNWNHYVIVSSRIYTLAYNLSTISNDNQFYNFVRNLFDNNSVDISGGDLPGVLQIEINKTNAFYPYYYDGSVFANPMYNFPGTTNEVVVLCETSDPGFVFLVRFDVNSNSVIFELYRGINLDYNNALANLSNDVQIANTLFSELLNTLRRYYDMNFTFSSSMSINPVMNNFILDSTILNNFDMCMLVWVTPSGDNVNDIMTRHKLNNNSVLLSYINGLSNNRIPFNRYENQIITFGIDSMQYVYFSTKSMGYVFAVLNNIMLLNSFMPLSDYDSAIISQNYSSIFGVNYFYDINQSVFNFSGNHNWLYFTDLRNNNIAPDYIVYPQFPRLAFDINNNQTNVMRYIMQFISGFAFIDVNVYTPSYLGALVEVPGTIMVDFSPSSFQLALESLDNVDLLIDNGFTSTISDYNIYAHRIAEHAINMEGEKIPALAVINTPINTTPTFTHGLPANLAINTFLTTSYFRYDGLGYPVLLPFTTLYVIKVTALHTNLNEFAPIFNKQLISVVPVDKVYSDVEREMLLANKINSPRIYQNTWAFNNNLTATFENIIFKEENIRRLSNAIAREVKFHLKTFIGQVNIRYTRERVVNKIREVLTKVIDINKYRPESYIIICDESNNTDYSNYLYVDVAIRMPMSVKYVVVVTIAQQI
ncbi:MAG: hypothetical protein QW255_05035 [Candidatus Bilamarchaeaceae archaeon]